MILSGDIGGTNTRLAIYRDDGGGPSPEDEATFPSGRYPGLGPIVAGFLEARGARPDRACFGVPGPVRDGRCHTTNLPWIVDARDLSLALRIPRVLVINDLEAAADGIPGVAPDLRVTIHPGSPDPAGNAALIAPGTGLGEAGLFWDGGRHRPFATEGGHASFAPRDALQRELLIHLETQHGHVSWERVVSGPGLVAIHEFLRRRERSPDPGWLSEALRSEDPAAVISTAAIDGRSETCGRALDLFIDCLGAEAGNLALKMKATGGVHVAGGIAPKILPRLTDGRLHRAFLDKGRMRPLLETMPVDVILDPRLALMGAARHAMLAR